MIDMNGDRPRGVETNGTGALTTSHLNLTRSLADVWRDNPPEHPAHPGRKLDPAEIQPRRSEGA